MYISVEQGLTVTHSLVQWWTLSGVWFLEECLMYYYYYCYYNLNCQFLLPNAYWFIFLWLKISSTAKIHKYLDFIFYLKISICHFYTNQRLSVTIRQSWFDCKGRNSCHQHTPTCFNDTTHVPFLLPVQFSSPQDTGHTSMRYVHHVIYNLTYLVTLRRHYTFHINSLHNYTHKTVHILYAETKQKRLHVKIINILQKVFHHSTMTMWTI